MRLRFFRIAAAVLAVCASAASSQSTSVEEMPDLLKGSAIRHTHVLTYGVPASYAAMRNPLPDRPKTWWRGAFVYAQKCANCHGPTGQGDGPGGQELAPAPANLGWFLTLPISRWDGFMYWTIAEGGQPLETTMPAYKESLPDDDIWAVTAYIRQTLGNTNRH